MGHTRRHSARGHDRPTEAPALDPSPVVGRAARAYASSRIGGAVIRYTHYLLVGYALLGALIISYVHV